MRKNRRFRHLKKNIKRFLVLLSVLVALALYAIFIEPNWFEVRETSLKLPHLSPEFNGYKIVQVTDFHADHYFKFSNFPRIVQTINEQKPDLVVLTGDYISRGHVEEAVGAIANNFQNITARDGVLAVLGNHDYWTNAKAVSRILTQHQIKLLKNQVVRIQRGAAELAIAGIDDIWSGQPDLEAILKDLGEKSGAILLAHEPDFADKAAATQKFDLQLSGHSHGGQVRLPFSEIVLPYLGRKYPYSQYQVENMIQYTSRGLGMGGIPVRFNCRPEITSLTLQSGRENR
jgi:uncharacterized protein